MPWVKLQLVDVMNWHFVQASVTNMTHEKGFHENNIIYMRRHQMETLSRLLAICAGNSPVPGEFPAQRPVTRSFDVFFDLHLNKQLSKQSWGSWFETLSRPLWRHRNEVPISFGGEFNKLPSVTIFLYFFQDAIIIKKYGKDWQWQDTKTFSNYYYISHTKPQRLNVSRVILQLSLHNSFKAYLKSRMKM